MVLPGNDVSCPYKLDTTLSPLPCCGCWVQSIVPLQENPHATNLVKITSGSHKLQGRPEMDRIAFHPLSSGVTSVGDIRAHNTIPPRYRYHQLSRVYIY